MRMCKREGCKSHVRGKSQYCDDCKDVVKRERERLAWKKWRASEGGKAYCRASNTAVIEEPAPEPKPVPKQLTEEQQRAMDEEQRALNAKVDRELYLRCGYGHGPVRKLTKEEIELVQVTPIDQIPAIKATPWAFKGVPCVN